MFKADNLSGLANYATARSNLGLVIGTNVQAFSSELAAIAALTTTSYGRALLTLANQAALVALMPKSFPILIDEQDLSASATYTSPTWTAGKYQKIVLEFIGSASAFSYLRFQANSDSSATYTDIGIDSNTAIVQDSAFKGTNGFARVGVAIGSGTSNCNEVIFFPLTTGLTRTGLGRSMSDGNSGTGGNSMKFDVGFAYNNTATDITFITYSVTGATMTGKVRLTGYLA